MPASLRSERDRLGIGTSGRNQIGISDSFRRNQHTRATNAKAARKIEAALKNALALGDVGILERKPAPTLAAFLKDSFQKFIDTEFKTKPNSLDYYSYGVKGLLASDLGSVAWTASRVSMSRATSPNMAI